MTTNVFDNNNYKKLENFRKFLENRGFKNKEDELTFNLYLKTKITVKQLCQNGVFAGIKR